MLILVRRESNAIAERYFNIAGEILSRLDEADFREAIGKVSSSMLHFSIRIWVGEIL